MSGIPYQPLNALRKEIRVLDLLPGWYKSPIQCRLRTVSIADEYNLPYYAALSYTWGSAENRKVVSISVGDIDYSTSITNNLFAALRGLRSRRKQDTLWVRLMSEVYSSATTTNIWLGSSIHPESPIHQYQSVHRTLWSSSHIMLQILRTLVGAYFPKELILHLRLVRLAPSDYGRHARFLVAQLRVDCSPTSYRLEEALGHTMPCWKDRAWVSQEFVLSKSRHLCYDRKKLAYKPSVSGRWWSAAPRERFSMLKRLGYSLKWREDLSYKDGHETLLQTARRACNVQASNMHDRVFSLLGLITKEEAGAIIVDYAAPYWVTCSRATFASATYHPPKDVFGFIPRSERLSFLECVSWEVDRRPAFPSWVVDFTRSFASPYDEFATHLVWPGSEDQYDVDLSLDL
ncbi:hypothetical protein LTR22_025518 [Elasticomyces elasticus]|nr:hypothetical protein LTR22_025518 [Elasticomyces elasticus]